MGERISRWQSQYPANYFCRGAGAAVVMLLLSLYLTQIDSINNQRFPSVAVVLVH
jgi:hypothetical protein